MTATAAASSALSELGTSRSSASTPIRLTRATAVTPTVIFSRGVRQRSEKTDQRGRRNPYSNAKNAVTISNRTSRCNQSSPAIPAPRSAHPAKTPKTLNSSRASSGSQLWRRATVAVAARARLPQNGTMAARKRSVRSANPQTGISCARVIKIVSTDWVGMNQFAALDSSASVSAIPTA